MKKIDFNEYLKKQIKEDPKLQGRLTLISVAIDISEQIYDLRKRMGLTQKKLSKKLGIPQSNLARLERADYTGYTLKTLVEIAEALDSELKVAFQPKVALEMIPANEVTTLNAETVIHTLKENLASVIPFDSKTFGAPSFAWSFE